MPELPEVETIMQEIRSTFKDVSISDVQINRPDLRRPFPSYLKEKLVGSFIKKVRRRAKYILIDLDNKWTLLIHLGMSGRLHIDHIQTVSSKRKHEHFSFKTNTNIQLALVDPRRFGVVDIFPTQSEREHPSLMHLGIEPLEENTLTGKKINMLFSQSRVPIKNALLDQRKIVGLGNIYVCEALFRAKIHPQKQARLVSSKEYERLSLIIPTILNEAIVAGGSSLRDYVTTKGEKGSFQKLHRVYGREGEECVLCKAQHKYSTIIKIIQSGRSTFFCPQHQKNVS